MHRERTSRSGLWRHTSTQVVEDAMVRGVRSMQYLFHVVFIAHTYRRSLAADHFKIDTRRRYIIYKVVRTLRLP